MIYGSLGDLTPPVMYVKRGPIMDSIFLFAKLSFSNVISVFVMSYWRNAYRPKLMGHAFE